jgi:hypothetical protein
MGAVQRLNGEGSGRWHLKTWNSVCVKLVRWEHIGRVKETHNPNSPGLRYSLVSMRPKSISRVDTRSDPIRERARNERTT